MNFATCCGINRNDQATTQLKTDSPSWQPTMRKIHDEKHNMSEYTSLMFSQICGCVLCKKGSGVSDSRDA